MKSALVNLLGVLSVLIISSYAGSSEYKIEPSRTLKLELYDPSRTALAEIPVRVRDLDTQKLAQLTLTQKYSDKSVWEGFFRLRFDNSSSNLRVIDFLNTEGTSYYAYLVSLKDGQKVKLFPSKEALENFIKTDPDLKAKAGTLSIPTEAKSIAVTGPSVTPSPSATAKPKVAQAVNPEMLEAKKRADMLAKAEKLSALEKEKNRQEAVRLATQADEFYQKGQFAQAKDLYTKALEMDPENSSYMYRYGVSLFKTQEYSKSLTILTAAEVPENLLVERDYYVALNYLKLEDYPKARKNLLEVRDENNPDFSAPAAFMVGTIDFKRQSFPSARKNMEYVLDNSKDVEMDRAAEDMLEQIDRFEIYLASKKEKYRFSFFGGPIYDQNVLNVASNNVSTDVQSFRALYGASALGIWYRTPNSDLGTKLAISDYYSTNTQFAADATLQAADALSFELTVPYHHEFLTASRTYNLEVQPFARSIALSTSGKSREEMIRSLGLSTSVSFPYNATYYLAAKAEASSETSFVSVTTSDDSQSGTKYGVTLSPTMLLDAKGERSVATELSYAISNAEGKNYRSNKLGLGVSYAAPIFWQSVGMARLDYATQNYSQATSPRVDTTYSLSGTLSKELNKSWSFMTNVQYTVANSDLDTYRYNKLMAMGLFTYTLSVQKK